MTVQQSPQDEDQTFNIEAEQQLLGALLNDNDSLDKVSDLVFERHFFEPLHGRLFTTISEYITAGRIASPITIKGAYERDDALKELGGPAYLARLSGAAISSFAIRDYAEIIVDAASKRDVLASCEKARQAVQGGAAPASKIAMDLEADAARVAAITTTRPLVETHLRGVMSAIHEMNEAYQTDGASAGVPTGIDRLDQKTKLRRGQMVLLAARSSMGKTSVAQSIIFNAASNRLGVFLGSLEMTRSDIANRFLSLGLYRRTGKRVPYSRMATGQMSEDEFRAVVEESKKQEALPILTGERECRDMTKMRSSVRQAQRRFEQMGVPLSLVVLDYVQLMTGSKARNGYERVSDASDYIKNLAMDLDVPVLALSQLSRGVEQRDPPIPHLSDLRESGKLEEDADVVIMLYREAYYLRRKAESAGDEDARAEAHYRLQSVRHDLDFLIEKNRGGPTGKVRAFMQEDVCWIGNDRPQSDGDLL